MREDNKRWLMSIMRTSGSERRHVINGNYSEERHIQKTFDPDDLPKRESIKSTSKVYNGKINYGLLIRFLRGKNGNDWDEVYSEIISRIPTKLLDYKEMIFWFVADKIEIIDGKLWDKKTQKFIWAGEELDPVHYSETNSYPEFKEFYVDPETNKLIYIQQKAYNNIARKNKK